MIGKVGSKVESKKAATTNKREMKLQRVGFWCFEIIFPSTENFHPNLLGYRYPS